MLGLIFCNWFFSQKVLYALKQMVSFFNTKIQYHIDGKLFCTKIHCALHGYRYKQSGSTLFKSVEMKYKISIDFNKLN